MKCRLLRRLAIRKIVLFVVLYNIPVINWFILAGCRFIFDFKHNRDNEIEAMNIVFDRYRF